MHDKNKKIDIGSDFKTVEVIKGRKLILNEVQQKIPTFLYESIEENWKRRIKKNPNLYPGIVFGLKSIKSTNKEIEINYFKTNYKLVAASRSFHVPGYEYFIGIRGVSLYVDEYVLMGKRNLHSYPMPGLWEPLPGGLLDPKDFEYEGNPLSNAFIREFYEETPDCKILEAKPVLIRLSKKHASMDVVFLCHFRNVPKLHPEHQTIKLVHKDFIELAYLTDPGLIIEARKFI